MKKIAVLLISLTFIMATFYGSSKVLAAKGTPESPDFGYGIRVDPGGQNIEAAMDAICEMKIDWILIDFDWASLWPDPQNQPHLETINPILQKAREYNRPVLISIRNAPAWAKTPDGPDPAMTSWFVNNLVRHYGDIIQAVELFPYANTTTGWGSFPNPTQYALVFQTVKMGLEEAGINITLVAGGLTPTLVMDENNLDDLAFLQGLYNAGAAQWMPIVSLRLPEITGSPLDSPENGNHLVLRHYEEIRQIMLSNQHDSGLIWITELAWPSGKISQNDVSLNSPAEQSRWLVQAYRQLRSQLYLGVTYYTRLNPPEPGSPDPQNGATELINKNNSHHPFTDLLQQLIAQNNQGQDATPIFTQQHKLIIKLRP